MKNKNKTTLACILLSIVLILQFSLVSVIALEDDYIYAEPGTETGQSIEEAGLLSQPEELQPMAAAACYTYHYEVLTPEKSAEQYGGTEKWNIACAGQGADPSKSHIVNWVRSDGVRMSSLVVFVPKA